MKRRNQTLINKVLEQIDDDLEYVDMYELVENSGLSYFHFHRVFKSYMGESLKQYIKRRRLEVSAHRLNYMKVSITDVALEAGFATPSAYNKAFKEFFGSSPSKYKKHRLELKDFKMIEPNEIKEYEAIDVYFIRHTGSYLQINEKFEKLMGFAHDNNMLNPSMKAYGVFYDDPTVTAEDKLRSEACISVVNKVESLPSDVEVKQIEGGKYATFLHEGSYENLINTYEQIFSTYIKENEVELRNVPCFEEYLNSEYDVKSTDELKTLIYIPLV